MFLGHSSNTSDQVLTTAGINGTPVLLASDADDSDLAAGMRFSAAFIFGAGGNIEATYLGNNEWGSTATVNTATPNTPDLYSFISQFGTAPQNGFQDTDQSLSQSITTYSTFHSAEVNYRRRTVEQYCRFQGSWLAGIRYLRYDDDYGYSTIGRQTQQVTLLGPNPNNPATNVALASRPITNQFNYRNEIDNKLFGPQAGFDLWWNVIPGINLGIAGKGAWLDNNIDRRTRISGNSIFYSPQQLANPNTVPPTAANPGTPALNQTTDDGINKSTVMGEFEATMLYRISHSWTLKSQYYVVAIDDIAQGFDLSGPTGLGQTPQTTTNGPIQTNSLTIQGVAFGAEYIW